MTMISVLISRLPFLIDQEKEIVIEDAIDEFTVRTIYVMHSCEKTRTRFLFFRSMRVEIILDESFVFFFFFLSDHNNLNF